MRLWRNVTEQLLTIIYDAISITVENQKSVILTPSCPSQGQWFSISIKVKSDRVCQTSQMKTISCNINYYWRCQAAYIIKINITVKVIIKTIVAVIILATFRRRAIRTILTAIRFIARSNSYPIFLGTVAGKGRTTIAVAFELLTLNNVRAAPAIIRRLLVQSCLRVIVSTISLCRWFAGHVGDFLSIYIYCSFAFVCSTSLFCAASHQIYGYPSKNYDSQKAKF